MSVVRVVIAGFGAACLLAAGVSGSKALTVELHGFGQSLGLTAACPSGLTRIAIVGSHRHALDCVLSARKVTKPGLDPWRIIESVRVTTPFSGGTIRSIENQTFTFTASGRSTALFRGRIIGGTGRYKGAAGSVSGGGPGRNGIATWRVTFQLR